MALEASTELLAGQWQRSERMLAAVDAPLAAIREDVLPAFDELDRMRHIDTAVGAWLDYLGTRVGLDRPSIPRDTTGERFGFEGAGAGWDRAPFHGRRNLDPLVPLPDAIFRRFIRARGDAGQVLSTVAFREVDPPCAGGGGLQFASCAVDPLASGVPARFASKNALYSSGTIPYGLSRVHRCFASCGGLRAA